MSKPLPSRPDPSLTERTPQGRKEEDALRRMTAPMLRRWPHKRSPSDPNPFPRFRLFRWFP